MTTTAWNGVGFGFSSADNDRHPMGIRPRVAPPSTAELQAPIVDDSDGHVLCVAPTGAGKGRGLIIPNLLHYPGSAVVLDIKGEAAEVTAQHRRDMGQNVYIIDPFRKVGRSSDSFNPLDICPRRSKQSVVDAAIMFAQLISGGQRSTRDPFWDDQADDLISALIAHAMTSGKRGKRTFGAVYDLLMSDDFDYNIAVLLDTEGDKIPPFAYRNIAAYLNLPQRETRPSALGTARQRMRVFQGDAARTSMAKTSFSIREFREGEPITIYLVVPPEKLVSHKAMLRLWISALLSVVIARTRRPALSTLFIIDEMAQLGPMPLIEQAVTLLRGYGLRTIMILQTLSQLHALYPNDPHTLTQNCNATITFGHKAYTMSRDMSALLGDISADRLYDLKDHLAALKLGKDHTRIIRRFDYLSDELFAGLYKPNSRFR